MFDGSLFGFVLWTGLVLLFGFFMGGLIREIVDPHEPAPAPQPISDEQRAVAEVERFLNLARQE